MRITRKISAMYMEVASNLILHKQITKITKRQERILLTVATFLALLLICLTVLKTSRSEPFPGSCENWKSNEEYIVPDLVHFYRSGPSASQFTWIDLACLKAAMKTQERVYIHTDDPMGTIQELRRYNLTTSRSLMVLPAPSTVALPPEISILWIYGGIFLLNDIYLLRNINEMRRYPMSRSVSASAAPGQCCGEILAATSIAIRTAPALDSSQWVSIPSFLLDKDYGALYIPEVLANCSYKAIRLGARH